MQGVLAAGDQKDQHGPVDGVPRNRVVLLGGLGGLPAAAEQTVKGLYHNYSLKQPKGPTFTN